MCFAPQGEYAAPHEFESAPPCSCSLLQFADGVRVPNLNSGSTDTSRRLFDALATGCVPVVVKNIGGKPREVLLANLPFTHSLNWRGLAYFLAAGGARIEHRRVTAATRAQKQWENTSMTWMDSCRREEAALLDTWHGDTTTLALLRLNALHAFRAHLDVELNPRGVASALLRELVFVLTDEPHSVYLPPVHLLPKGMQQWENMSGLQWLWKRYR